MIPASWLLFSTIGLIFLFIALNVQGWAGFLVYTPLLLLVVDLVVLPKLVLLDRVLVLLKAGRKHNKFKDYDAASQCYEQAMLLQEGGNRLGLSMVLNEYSQMISKFDEEESNRLREKARGIQLDALNGKFNDIFHVDHDQF